MDQWEYKSFRVNGPDLEGKLNLLGAQGWELVNIVVCQATGGGMSSPNGWLTADEYRVVLKRRRQ
jgi:hypothetical protein